MSLKTFDKNVCLYYTNNSHRGPGKVVENLEKGLQAVGVQIKVNTMDKEIDYCGILQAGFDSLIENNQVDKNKVLLGPNLFVLPSDNIELCKMGKNFVVPSIWVKKLYQQNNIMKDKNIHVWPVGINTKKWAPIPPRPPWKNLDCFIYHKNRSEQDLRLVEAICKKYNLKYEVIKYGSYYEDDLYKLCQTMNVKNGFVILLNGTESQGVAYMQILSSNVPCYVFNKSVWKSDDGNVTCEASSVPYFDEKCGEIANDIQLDHFVEFVENVKLHKYNPRKYILENHTLEKAATNYIDLLRICNGE